MFCYLSFHCILESNLERLIILQRKVREYTLMHSYQKDTKLIDALTYSLP